MDCSELIEILNRGEDSRHQFKENFYNIDKLTIEISAFANSDGGKIIIGVSDSGETVGINREDVNRLNQWISNATSSKIEPPIFVTTEILMCDEKRVLIIYVPRGKNKPYAVKKVEFWVKTGADKRRATREELLRLMQASKLIYADEFETEARFNNFDAEFFLKHYNKYYEEELEVLEIPITKLLENIKLMKEQALTLAGLLLFAKKPEHIRPQFCIKATSFAGDDVTVDLYRDSENIGGKLIDQFQEGVAFVKRNLKRIQGGQNFNAPGILEIPEGAFSEAISNAIIHRDYFINAPINVYIFDTRLEIISPGNLPDTITEENIKFGVHFERNPTILSFLEKDKKFRYSGRGSGIPRVIKKCKEANINVEFLNDKSKQQFKVIFQRRDTR